MNKIRVLVADDEPLARRGVRQLLAPHSDITVVGESRNGAETLRALDEVAPDLLFLDIQMPEMDGFQVLRARGAHRLPAIIFVTAHDQFAVNAFEAQALDYLVKPLNVKRFESSLQRVRERLRLTRAADTRQSLVVATGTGKLVIPLAEIDWISAEDYYACLHLAAKSQLLRESLSSLEERLDPQQFVRVHRSAIVQLDRVRQFRTTSGAGEVILRDGSRIPVSRRKRILLASILRNL